MHIKFNSMSERPTKSCDVVMVSSDLELISTCYSKLYDKFNTRDTDDEESVVGIAAYEPFYHGWIYYDELLQQMVVEHEAV